MTRKIKKDADIYMGSQLKKRRTELRLTKEYLAAELGITVRQFDNYESGASAMSLVTRKFLIRLLKVPVSHFSTSEPDSTIIKKSVDKESVEFYSSTKTELNRVKTHGYISDTLTTKALLVKYISDTKNFKEAKEWQKQALILAMCKLSRLLNGDKTHADHLIDLVSYLKYFIKGDKLK